MKREIFIDGMTCNHCKMRVEKTLNGIDGVTSAQVILADQKAVVESERELDEALITELIDDAGYTVVRFQ